MRWLLALCLCLAGCASDSGNDHSTTSDNNTNDGEQEPISELIEEGKRLLAQGSGREAEDVFAQSLVEDPPEFECAARWGLALAHSLLFVDRVNEYLPSRRANEFQVQQFAGLLSGVETALLAFDSNVEQLILDTSTLVEMKCEFEQPSFPVKIELAFTPIVDVVMGGRFDKVESQLFLAAVQGISAALNFILAHDLQIFDSDLEGVFSGATLLDQVRSTANMFVARDTFLARHPERWSRIERISEHAAEAIKHFMAGLRDLEDQALNNHDKLLRLDDSDGNGIDGGDTFWLAVQRNYGLTVEGLALTLPDRVKRRSVEIVYGLLERAEKAFVDAAKGSETPVLFESKDLSELLTSLDLTRSALPNVIRLDLNQLMRELKPLRELLPIWDEDTGDFQLELEFELQPAWPEGPYTVGDGRHFVERVKQDGSSRDISIDADCVAPATFPLLPYVAWGDPSAGGAIDVRLDEVSDDDCDDASGWQPADNYNFNKLTSYLLEIYIPENILR